MGEPWDRLAGLHCCHVNAQQQAAGAHLSRHRLPGRGWPAARPRPGCTAGAAGGQVGDRGGGCGGGAECGTAVQRWSRAAVHSWTALTRMPAVCMLAWASRPPLLYHRRDRGVARHLQGRAGRARSSTGVISRRAPQGADLGTRQESCSSDARQEACHSSEPTVL